MRPRQWAGTAQGWGLSKPTKGTPEHPPLMGGEGPVPCPGGTGPLITSFSSASQPLAQELGQATPRGDSWHTVGAQKMCPVPPFPPRTELGQALADCSPQQPPSCPRLAAPEQDPGESPVSLPTPTHHGCLQLSPASATRASVAAAPGSSCVPLRGPRPPAPLPCSSADWLLPRGLPVSRARLRWNYSPRPAPAAGSGASWLGRALSSLFLPGPSEVPVG